MTPWTATCQASQSFTISQNLFKLMFIESVMPSNHLVLCHPLLPLPSIFLRVFSNESALCIRWSKYWSFSFSTSPSNEYSGLTLGLTGLLLQGLASDNNLLFIFTGLTSLESSYKWNNTIYNLFYFLLLREIALNFTHVVCISYSFHFY